MTKRYKPLKKHTKCFSVTDEKLKQIEKTLEKRKIRLADLLNVGLDMALEKYK